MQNTEKVILTPDMTRGDLLKICQDNNIKELDTLFILNSNGVLWTEDIYLDNVLAFSSLLSVLRGFSQALLNSMLSHYFPFKKKKMDTVCSSFYDVMITAAVNPRHFSEGTFTELQKEHVDMVLGLQNKNMEDFKFTPEFLADVVSSVPFFSGYLMFMTEYYKKLIRQDITPLATAKKAAMAILSHLGELIPGDYFKLSRFIEEYEKAEQNEQEEQPEE